MTDVSKSEININPCASNANGSIDKREHRIGVAEHAAHKINNSIDAITTLGLVDNQIKNWRTKFSELDADDAIATVSEALCDKLTGLPNRRAVYERLHLEIERSKRSKNPLSVVMIDLDGFKIVNDKNGHEAGDDVLRRVADNWSKRIRETDLIGRLGGDEFTLVLPDSDSNGAKIKAENLRKSIAEEFENEPKFNSVGASFGVYQISGSDTTLSSMRKADEALYLAKKLGRNLVEVWSSETSNLLGELRLEKQAGQ